MAGWHTSRTRSGYILGVMLTATGYNGTQARNDEVAALIGAYRDRGDRRAIERIIDLHRKILNSIVRRHAVSSGEPYEDLLQVGYVGLIKAIKGYNVDSAAKFSSYAYSMIDGELRHHFRDTELVKKPRWARSLYAKVSEANARLTAELGRPPLVEEIATEVNVSREGILELMKLFRDTSVMSLDAGEDCVDVSAIRSIQYQSFSLPVEDRIVLEEALESLTEIQRKVVYLFFYKDLSQTEIGHMLSLPQRKISRIIASAMKALRDSHDANYRNLEWRD
jgi:RNA polymerase sigma-B factor